MDQRPYWYPGMTWEACIQANRGLVEKLVHWCMDLKRRPKCMSEEDARQEAFLGMKRALDSYDESRGTKFSTHAVWQMRASIQAGMRSYLDYPAYLIEVNRQPTIYSLSSPLPVTGKELDPEDKNGLSDQVDSSDLLDYAIRGMPKRLWDAFYQVKGLSSSQIQVAQNLGVCTTNIQRRVEDAITFCRRRLSLPGYKNARMFHEGRKKAKTTPSEKAKQIVSLIKQGFGVEEIAEKLNVRAYVVKYQKRKLNETSAACPSQPG